MSDPNRNNGSRFLDVDLRRFDVDYLEFWEQAKYWLAGIVVVLYLAGVTDFWAQTPDSSLYLSLAESLEQGEGYAIQGVPHVHVPPGFPAMLASLRSIGLRGYLGLNFAMVLTALLTLYLVYRSMRTEFGPVLGGMVSLLLALSFPFFLNSLRLLSDIPFMFLVWMGIACFTRARHAGARWLILGALAMFASCFFRVVGIPIVATVGVGLLLERRRHEGRSVWPYAFMLELFVCGLACCYFVYHQSHNGDGNLPSYRTMFPHLLDRANLDWLLSPFINTWDTSQSYGKILFGQLVPPWLSLPFLILPTLLGAVICTRQRRYFGVLLSAGYLVPLLLNHWMIDRYLLPVAPFLFAYFMIGLFAIFDAIPRLSPGATQLVVNAVVVCLGMHLARDVVEVRRLQVTHGSKYHRDWGKVEEVARLIQERNGGSSMFISDMADGELMYLSGTNRVYRGFRAIERAEDDTAYLKKAIDGGARTVVLFKPYPDAHRRAIESTCASRGLELVASSGPLRVYSATRTQ